MLTVESIAELRATILQWRQAGLTVAFVPTMGNLHAGHLRLVEQAKRHADRLVVSIFVNPMQFGPSEDFLAYPRTLDEDTTALRTAEVDLLFTPNPETVYPTDSAGRTFVEVPGLFEQLCGQHRHGHFRGVATVVCKLFNMVQPDVAFFGEKDYQQLTIIRKMVADLDIPVTIRSVATVREASGLAMSSRNGYLNATEKDQAASIYGTLCEASDHLRRGNSDFAMIESLSLRHLTEAGFRPDYFAIRRADDLSYPQSNDHDLIILVAAWLGKARLIDNLRVNLNN